MSDEEKKPNFKADVLLQLMVGFANKGSAAPLTLFVGGSLISGILIGRREYLDLFTTQFSTGWEADDVRELKDSFGVFDEPDESEGDDFEGITYIHLRDAKVYAPGQRPLPTNGLLWRGKLAAVDGFSYGMFGPASEDE